MQIDIANTIAAVAALSALIVSLYTLRQQRRLEQVAYISLALTLERIDEHRLLARTSLENRSPTPKYLSVVRLLVCPQAERPEQACDVLINDPARPVSGLPDIGRIELTTTLRDDQRALVPLHYYTTENTEIGDELLTYDAVLDIGSLRPGTVYAVRLFLYGPDRLHRVVHRAFIR